MPKAEFPIAAIGASAGGLEALQKFVSAIPRQTGICYVIVQHLAPDHPSIMDQLLAAHSAIDVVKIEEGMRPQPDKIYVIPAGSALTISEGTFHLHDHRKERGVRTPIDRFFKSVAEEIGRKSICIILSGTASDGTAGLRAVKAAGGIAFVQESDSARFPGMPDSAVATGLVDFVMTAERIPDRLIEIVDHRARMEDAGLQERLHDALKERLPEITRMLRETTGQDFTSYKPGTLLRRIERRMALLRERSVEGLMQRLERDEEERSRLTQDFLIGVTHFFRDPEAFKMLHRDAVTAILDARPDKIRIWVPGCSTGEEAYSLAIMVLDEMDARGMRASLQVFGTDIDASALMSARQGLYPAQSMNELPETLLEKHFVAEDGGYRTNAVLRECCIFAPHNLLSDPPFSRLDLVSCRNLLIYLNADGQHSILPRFHYALKKGGYMFLGPSETLGKHDDLFSTVSKKHRIFKRNDEAEHGYSALTTPQVGPGGDGKRPLPTLSRKLNFAAAVAPSIDTAAEAFFLKSFAAPFAVIDKNNCVIYLSEQMVRFVKPSKGAPTAELDSYLARDLRMPLRAAIAEVRKNGMPVETQDIVVEEGESRRLIDIKAHMLGDGDAVMIVLQHTRQPDSDALAAAAEGQRYPGRDLVEHELVSTRQHLEATLADYETSSQELRSTNEELLSMNEELQSANEELETSREELQSINEELETMNAELNENNEQLRRANSDIKNLFESTEVATLFLDSQLCVRGHTPMTTALFGIRDRDAGRPVSELVQRFDHGTLIEDIEEVGRSLTILEREVTIAKTNQTYIMRVRPYRTIDNRIDGYVLTFFEISQRKQNEATLKRNADELSRQYGELETLYDTTPVGLCLVDRDYKYVRINARLAEINGFSIEEHIGARAEDLIPDIDGKVKAIQTQVFKTGEPALHNEIVGTTPGEPGVEKTWIADYYPVTSGDQVFAVGVCVRDVTEERKLRADLAENLDRVGESEKRKTLLLAELQHRVKNTLASISAITRFIARSTDSVPEMQRKLVTRLEAMSRTHDLLTDSDWAEVSVVRLMENELSPYTEIINGRVEISGDDLALNPEEALAVGLAFHELVANSVKHGAFGSKEGQVSISIDAGTKGRDARFRWYELGDFDDVRSNKAQGFGTFLLETAIAPQLKGTASLNIEKGSVEFLLDFPRGTRNHE